MLAIFLIILLLIIFYYNNNKLIGGLNNKMEILQDEISQMNTSNNDYEDNNDYRNNNDYEQNDEYSYAISDTTDLGNMYGNYSIPNILNLYIK